MPQNFQWQMTMTFNQEKIKQLRTIGHQLKPIVTIGDNGLSDSVLEELNRALNDHELIKIKLAVDDREARQAVLTDLVAQSRAVLVQQIGKVALICRLAKKANPKLSNLHRPI